jgi:nucleotide-binding universal stress UspA family protein
MKRILAATDLSDRSERAVARAAMLAAQSSADLALVHVVENSQPEHLVTEIERLATTELDAMARSLGRLHGIRCDPYVVRGDAFSGIVGTAAELSADLIAMGIHRRSLLKDVLVGTTLERVIRARGAPTLVVTAAPAGAHRSALVAVDFSDCSGRALEIAVSLGLLAGTSATVAYISDPAEVIRRDVSPDEIDARIAAAALNASQELTKFVQNHDTGDVQFSARVRPEDGPPAVGIQGIASDLGADLVVVGVQGRGRVSRMLLGSVTDALLKTLDADLLVVPCAA